jgi:thiol-disulfide isomerase/thioredoxin
MSAVAVWALIVLVAINILLTYGVIRRLNEHEAKITELGQGGESDVSFGNPIAGFAAPDFEARTTAGATVKRSDVNEGVHYIGFFSKYCSPCHEMLPQFLEFAAGRDADQVLIVMEGPEDETSAMVGDGANVSRVVLESLEGPVRDAFGVDRYPAMLLLQDGVVVKNAATLGQLLVAQSATL